VSLQVSVNEPSRENVVSEFMRPLPAPELQSWISSQLPSALFISAVTEADLRLGLELLALGKRRDGLEAAMESMPAQDFAGQILPLDRAAATAFAQIASIARCRSASMAAHNIADYADCGISVINPWRDEPVRNAHNMGTGCGLAWVSMRGRGPS